MGAGQRDTRVVFEAATVSTDAHGEDSEAWAEFAVEWAQVFWGRGDERRAAAVERGSQAATLQVLANDRTRALTVRHRVTFGGSTWDIVGLSPDMPKRGLMEITVIRSL